MTFPYVLFFRASKTFPNAILVYVKGDNQSKLLVLVNFICIEELGEVLDVTYADFKLD